MSVWYADILNKVYKSRHSEPTCYYKDVGPSFKIYMLYHFPLVLVSFAFCSLWATTYCRWEFDPVVQISEPEEVSEAMCDVKRIELLVSQIQKSQDVDIVLIASAKGAAIIVKTSKIWFQEQIFTRMNYMTIWIHHQ